MLKIPFQYQPVCLYTYETAIVQEKVMECTTKECNAYELFEKHFPNKWDNKICIEFKHRDTGKKLYLSVWDGNISLGLEVWIQCDLTKASNSYRKIMHGNRIGEKLIAFNPCIMEDDEVACLTVGREYPVIEEDDERIYVKDDQGDRHAFTKDQVNRFFNSPYACTV